MRPAVQFSELPCSPPQTSPLSVGERGRAARQLRVPNSCQRRGRSRAVSICETDKPCKARPAVLPYVLPKLPGFGSRPDRVRYLLHVRPASAAPVVVTQP
jgi:hypothetical protein